MAACPYERRYFNWGEPHTEEERAKLTFADYSPEYPVPHRKGTVEKCDFCSHTAKYGKLPACVEACTKAGMKTIYFGDAYENAVSNGAEMVKLSDLLNRRLGFRWKEELGTEPRVYYLPPSGKR
jgi:molybdopterin-containing oxidoreductase family iron-sulfur binding subunit